MSLINLQNQSNLELTSLPDGLLAIFTAKIDSNLAKTQLENLAKSDLENISAYFLTTESGSSSSDRFLSDSKRELINQIEILKSKSNLGENLVFLKKEGLNFKYLVHKENPENQYDWRPSIQEFAVNYVSTTPDDKGLWKWGQIVPETGEYLCVDCGFIDNFEAGAVFPVCEVCLSGEPAGPSGAEIGFWERV